VAELAVVDEVDLKFPSARCSLRAIRSWGRGRLPAWLVKIRSGISP
jgi:hypothetical protein